MLIERRQYLQFRVETSRFALPVERVLRVFRAVEMIPLPGAPARVQGLVNYGGKLVPVFHLGENGSRLDARSLLHANMIIAERNGAPAAVLADQLDGVTDVTDELQLEERDAGSGSVAAGFPDGNEVVLIQDVDKFLSWEQEAALREALKATSDER